MHSCSSLLGCDKPINWLITGDRAQRLARAAANGKHVLASRRSQRNWHSRDDRDVYIYPHVANIATSIDWSWDVYRLVVCRLVCERKTKCACAQINWALNGRSDWVRKAAHRYYCLRSDRTIDMRELIIIIIIWWGGIATDEPAGVAVFGVRRWFIGVICSGSGIGADDGIRELWGAFAHQCQRQYTNTYIYVYTAAPTSVGRTQTTATN